MNEQTAAWIRSFIGPVAAAGMGAVAAYLGIRSDLYILIHRVDVQEQVTKDHEDRIRDIERSKRNGAAS